MWAMRELENLPLMVMRRGRMPRHVLGKMERKRIGIIHSSPPFLANLVHNPIMINLMMFYNISAVTNLKFMLHGSLVEIK